MKILVKIRRCSIRAKRCKWKVVGEYKTDKNGEINVKDLAYGKYSFVEKASPNGYVLVKEPIMFEIKEHGKIIELLAVNHLIKGDLEITKVDVADGNNKLPNAEFTIYNEAGKEVVKGKQTIKESLNLKSYHLENTHIKKLLHQKVMY